MTTLEMLQLEFDGPTARLDDVAAKYLGIRSKKLAEMAKSGSLPLPAFRLGSQKTPWLVNLTDLADLIDRQYQEARTDWEGHQE